MILAKSLYTKNGVICAADDLEADTCWGHEGQVMDDARAKELGVIGTEYDSGENSPTSKIVMHAGRIGGSKAMKPAEDKQVDEPEGDKGLTVTSSPKRGK